MRPCHLAFDRKHSALPEKCPFNPGRRDLLFLAIVTLGV